MKNQISIQTAFAILVSFAKYLAKKGFQKVSVNTVKKGCEDLFLSDYKSEGANLTQFAQYKRIGINFSYERSINRRLKENDLKPNFKAQPQRDGSRHIFGFNTLLQNAEGRIFLQLGFAKNSITEKVWSDGVNLYSKEDLIRTYGEHKFTSAFLKRKVKEVKTQTKAGLVFSEKKSQNEQLQYRKIAIDTVVTINFDGEKIDIVGNKKFPHLPDAIGLLQSEFPVLSLGKKPTKEEKEAAKNSCFEKYKQMVGIA